ncbi:hypothetical protein [Methylobacter sp. YRD-M1]|uniref:hypothetical protein n=1 Tax=Methylobacter sp. YRD-M1 TaxID=2911520 RepID=UPI00227B7C94|nr:hypothetical protein [Methylobacter sp. YRD-M1]WAK03823.1 hypothetical protein LZ558_08575 [Methylobacter sp. YRD-M1]
MPIDKQWQQLTITGIYPKARFFSLAVYDNAPVSTGLADHLFDAQIVPDPGSCNPFAPDSCNPSAKPDPTYTVTVARSNDSADNMIQLHADTGWLIYRLYLPNAGEGSMGGVPLPEIKVTDASGQTTTLTTCPVVNRQSELSQLQPQIVTAELENPLEHFSIPPVADRIWFGAIKEPPPFLLPNPDQKYLISFFMPEYKPDRVIVIRGKMPAFPDTYHGNPVSQPARGFKTVQLRYWGLCQAELVSPLPVSGCTTDANTPLDGQGFYTIIVSNDVLRPEWLPKRVVWLPWGDEKMVPKLMFMRNLLASADFSQSVQSAVDQGCGFNLTFPTPPTQDVIETSGRCAQEVMGDYYPEAVWCDRQTFISGGWQACFRAADEPVRSKPQSKRSYH